MTHAPRALLFIGTKSLAPCQSILYFSTMIESRFGLTRRAVLGAAGLLVPSAAWAANQGYDAPGRAFAEMESRLGLRIGVAALDTGSGKSVFYREAERFLMCSTFKMLLVATVLSRVDRGREQLNRLVRYQKSDVLDYAPVTSKNVARGMSVRELCAAAITFSDNTAANLLLAAIGGPQSVMEFARGLGDGTTRLDRTEPTLNIVSGDLDTTTPAATLADLKDIALGETLSPASRKILTDLMIACETGLTRLRGGLPPGWKAGDKTGSGGQGELNDLAIVWPSGNRAPILVCAYTVHNDDNNPAHQRALADISRAIAARFM
jgi:beta-lactamase class A